MKCSVCGHAVSGHKAEGCQAQGCSCKDFEAAVQAVALAADTTDNEPGTPGGPPADPAPDAAPTDVPVAADDDPAALIIDVFIAEGVETEDGRMVAPGALTARPMPLPLWLLTTQSDGHDGATLAGSITSLTHQSDGTWSGTATLDLDGDGGEARRLIAGGFLKGISADMVAQAMELQVNAVDDDGMPIGFLEVYTEAVITGGTLCPDPAFVTAQVHLSAPDATSEDLTDPMIIPIMASGAPRTAFAVTMEEPCVPCARGTLVAAGGPVAPPAAWFADPKLTGPTPITITDDGRVFGHLAQWGVCHVGIAGACVTAPHSMSNYERFTAANVQTAEGTLVRTGPLTFATGHAASNLNEHATVAHYDNTGTAWADVAVGEDEHGIWVAGGARPGLSDVELREIRGSRGLSGDWRTHLGNLELVAALTVNVPGFPIAMVAAGAPQSLVAAGAIFEAPKPAPLSVAEQVAAQMAAERKADRALALLVAAPR